MRTFWLSILATAASVITPQMAPAAPEVSEEPQRLVVTAPGYRATFHRWQCDLQLELRDKQGNWRSVTKRDTRPEFAIVDAHGVHASSEAPARLSYAADGSGSVVGVTTLLPTSPPTTARIDFVCTDDGLLVRMAAGGSAGDGATCWSLPRLGLDETLFDGYAFWSPTDELRHGSMVSLGTSNVFAGVSAWGGQGDTAAGLSPRHPAIVARSSSAGVAIAVVLPEYRGRWAASHSFLQRYNSQNLFFYTAIADRPAATQGNWAWLAPMPGDLSAAATKVARLASITKTLTAEFHPIAPEPGQYWNRPVPDFPKDLRRSQPVQDIRRAVVYTINETIHSDDGIDLARKTGSDVLIRGWFKWATAPDYRAMTALPPKAHQMGALFGGGITCSALYHGESGLTEKQVLDMATRGPAGQLIDAWGVANVRHGTLSNPAYLEFLLASCKRQIDAGADVLFMDEANAALQADEGFDDYSNADFRTYLADRHAGQGWTPTDSRWQSVYKINLADPSIARDHTIHSFQYREYLKSLGLVANPHGTGNPLAAQWHAFRADRDDRAWKWLTDAIRRYAASRGRQVHIDANGLARYVDLQVLGIWEEWQAAKGKVDLAESQLDRWGSMVAAGWSMADRKVPVVLFHDWGVGGFPWMAISPADRQLWIRIRGAEIYAAGGFFAFPVHGPFGNDSRQDDTLPEIARQSRFYHQHQDLYLDADFLGFEPLEAAEPDVGLALWKRESPPAFLLHAINHQVQDGTLRRRTSVAVNLPTGILPKTVTVVSPDWQGEKHAQARVERGKLKVVLPELEAYSVAILHYDRLPEIALLGRRIVPSVQWARPVRNEFVVRKSGMVDQPWALPGMLHGMLHQHLRNPPTLVVNMPKGGSLSVHIRGVATLGAKLQWQVDGRIEKLVDLPDRDGKNDALAREYDETFEFPIPPGRHRLALDNIGGDWACIGWYAVTGERLDP